METAALTWLPHDSNGNLCGWQVFDSLRHSGRHHFLRAPACHQVSANLPPPPPKLIEAFQLRGYCVREVEISCMRRASSTARSARHFDTVRSKLDGASHWESRYASVAHSWAEAAQGKVRMRQRMVLVLLHSSGLANAYESHS